MIQYATWFLAAISAAGVVIRPWRVPEVWWAVLGGLSLVLFGLLPVQQSLQAIAKGTDIYLFLAGMMLLTEIARQEGVFDYLAGLAVSRAKGSASRLFVLVYGVGIAVTVFMSNDATAVVLTPAVYAAARKAKTNPLPYLFACAFIANAASFVLPISNPANLVVYGEHLPSLFEWFGQFALPSLLSIGVTFWVLRWYYQNELRNTIEKSPSPQKLKSTGILVLWGIGAVTFVMLVASALGLPLGLPALAASVVAAAVVCFSKRAAPWPLLGGISWSVLPLVAGLFVLVEGLDHTGALKQLSQWLAQMAAKAPNATAWGASMAVAFGGNLINNLPAGLIAGSAVAAASVGPMIQGAVVIGIDLGPNLSVTGSLATILWLIALRREGVFVSGWQFLKVGAIAMPAALVVTLSGYALTR